MKLELFYFQNQGIRSQQKIFWQEQKNNIYLVPGSGIPKYFDQKTAQKKKKYPHNFIYCGRLLKSKGILNFIKLAQLNKEDNFHVYGEIDLSRKNSIHTNDFAKFKKIRNLYFHGSKVDPLINSKISNLLYSSSSVLSLSYIYSKLCLLTIFKAPPIKGFGLSLELCILF